MGHRVHPWWDLEWIFDYLIQIDLFVWKEKEGDYFIFLESSTFMYIQNYDIFRFTELTIFYSTVKLGDKEWLDSERPSVSEQFCNDKKVP